MTESAGTRTSSAPAGSRWRWVALAVLAIGVIVLWRLVPADRLLDRLTDTVAGLGPWGPLLFGVAYVLAAVLLIPASALTLAAGALFGLAQGTLVVAIAATVAAAIAFLIGRYAARDLVEARAQRSPTFGAIDRAIARGGWKVVALLRLSPAMPFSLGNYLFGLTAVAFWPYVAATAVAILPGVFMYAYIGYVGRQVAAGDATASTGRWILLVAGLVATAVVTVYITRLARRSLDEQTGGEVSHDS